VQYAKDRISSATRSAVPGKARWPGYVDISRRSRCSTTRRMLDEARRVPRSRHSPRRTPATPAHRHTACRHGAVGYTAEYDISSSKRSMGPPRSATRTSTTARRDPGRSVVDFKLPRRGLDEVRAFRREPAWREQGDRVSDGVEQKVLKRGSASPGPRRSAAAAAASPSR
jgi:hypothetical protein